MVGPQILTAATARSVLLLNDEHDFFRLYFFTSDLADLEQILRDADFPSDIVAGYLTKAADENIAATFQRSGFNPIASYRRMITYRLPPQQPNPSLEYAVAADVDQIYEGLFQTFNKYTDHLPTKNRLHSYVVNQWVIVNRQASRILGAVCFQLEGPRVNYNYLYNLSQNALDFLRLQNNFYGVMHQRDIRAGFLWINQTDTRLAALHESMGWRFDGLQDYFYRRSSVNRHAPVDSTRQIKDVTPDNVREFLLTRYSEPIKGMGWDPVEVPDSFDFLLSGVIDSFGILEMISSIEDEFRIRLDLAALDAEQITILGPLSQYVAGNAKAD
jgi:acyl carrier protein